MQLKVSTLNKVEVTIDADSNLTIYEVKKLLQEKLPEMDHERQILIHKGEILENKKKLLEYPKIESNDRIIVVASKLNKSKSNVQGGPNQGAASTGETQANKTIAETTLEQSQVADKQSSLCSDSSQSQKVKNDNINPEESVLISPLVNNVQDPNIVSIRFQGQNTSVSREKLNALLDKMSAIGVKRDVIESICECALFNLDKVLEWLCCIYPEATYEIAQYIKEKNPEDVNLLFDHLNEFCDLVLTSGGPLGDVIDQDIPIKDSETDDALDQISQIESIPGSDASVTVQVTETQREAILTLQRLGFGETACLRALILCDWNQDAAANYLFEYPSDSDDEIA